VAGKGAAPVTATETDTPAPTVPVLRVSAIRADVGKAVKAEGVAAAANAGFAIVVNVVIAGIDTMQTKPAQIRDIRRLIITEYLPRNALSVQLRRNAARTAA